MHVHGKTKLGFFPLPISEAKRLKNYLSFTTECSALDPCVGDGVAFSALLEGSPAKRYGIEIDAHRTSQARALGIEVLQANTTDVRCPVESVSLLYLNPPYDWESGQSGNQRLEFVFLEHTYRWLKPDGNLIFVIPQARLKPCARLLADHFKDLRVYRLASPECVRFKQIAVLAVRRKRTERPRDSILLEIQRYLEGLAMRFFNRAIKLAGSDKDLPLPFMAYEGKAQVLVASGKANDARTVLQDALAKARAERKRGHESQLLILLGSVAEKTGDYAEAIDNLEKARQLATRFNFYRMDADATFELAKLYRDNHDLATAEARADEGLAASQRVGDRYYVPRNLTVLADLKALLGRPNEANQLYEQAEDVVEGMLVSVDEPYWNSSVVASMSQTYLRNFELAAKEGDVPGAFRVLERVRGRTLAWALADKKAFAAESEKTASLEPEIASLQLRLMQSNDRDQRELLLDQLMEYERRLGFAWTKGDVSAQLLPVQPSTLWTIEGDLKPEEVLLEYVLDDPNSFCLSITRRDARLEQLPAGRKEIETLIKTYISETREKQNGTAISKQLYNSLVKPISDVAGASRLTIVPDGILNLLPFEALQNSAGEFLIRSREITYVPSGTILETLRRLHKRPAPKSLLAIGDVAYEDQGNAGKELPASGSLSTRLERGVADLSGIALHDLPQTRDEVEKIGRLVGHNSVILVGRDATETAFKKEPLGQFRIIHLAVHGFADIQYPERSALILGRDPNSTDDGLLQVREIIRLKLNAELATLSACDTGVGKLQGEEGVSNLVEAFLMAGARSVVASLWSVDDTSSTTLMEDFYQRLTHGETVSSALRNAKLDMLSKFGNDLNPYYWSAFISIGQTSTPITIQK